MRLTRAGEYAVRCVVHLATIEKGKVVSRKEVARAMDIPEPFLGKITKQLTLAGILDVVQGARGGYRLATDPRKISLLEVVEAIMGKICLNDCVDRPESCHRNPICTVHPVWKNARDQLRETLGGVSFYELSNGNGNGSKKKLQPATPAD